MFAARQIRTRRGPRGSRRARTARRDLINQRLLPFFPAEQVVALKMRNKCECESSPFAPPPTAQPAISSAQFVVCRPDAPCTAARQRPLQGSTPTCSRRTLLRVLLKAQIESGAAGNQRVAGSGPLAFNFQP
jgi:hypothetical protein